MKNNVIANVMAIVIDILLEPKKPHRFFCTAHPCKVDIKPKGSMSIFSIALHKGEEKGRLRAFISSRNCIPKSI